MTAKTKRKSKAPGKQLRPTAAEFYAEFGERIEHVEEILVGVKSKMGNYFLATQTGVSCETLRRIRDLLNDELEEPLSPDAQAARRKGKT